MSNINDSSNFISRQLLRYRNLLANFSRRNKELYFRPSKSGSLSLSVDLPPKFCDKAQNAQKSEELEESLDDFKNKNSFAFSPFSISSSQAKNFLESNHLDLSQHFNLFNRPNLELEARIEKIKSADIKYQKEYGISGAWFLGPFLLWRETSAYSPDELLISPIFKLPVDIVRKDKTRWYLELEEADLHFNPSLQLALNKQIGVALPTYTEATNIESATYEVAGLLAKDSRIVTILGSDGNLERYSEGMRIENLTVGKQISEKIKAAINSISEKLVRYRGERGPSLPQLLSKMKIERDEDGNIIGRRFASLDKDLSEDDRSYYEATTFDHFIIVDTFYIDHINATRMPLFRDYEQAFEMLADHLIINELLGQGPAPSGSEKAKLPRELDKYYERENFFVIPTDSSQHGAIKLANSSQTIVIQGPPGTGKSQTITNLIADKIANGKKVLFVAEKRAALDVVYSRLKLADIDKQAVLIHNSDVNRRELYESFLELANAKPKDEDKEAWDHVGSRLDRVKSSINEYYDTAISIFAHTKLSITEVLALYASNATSLVDDNVQIGQFFASRITGADLDELCDELNQLQDLVAVMKDYEQHPWKNKRSNFIVAASSKLTFADLCIRMNTLAHHFMILDEDAKDLFSENQLRSISNKELDELLADSADIIKKEISDNVAEIVLVLSTSQTEKSISEIELQFRNLSKELAEAWPMCTKFQADADPELIDELARYTTAPRRIIDTITPAYWRAKRILKIVTTEEGFKSLSLRKVDSRPFKAFFTYQDRVQKLLNLIQKLKLENDFFINDKSWFKLESIILNQLQTLSIAKHLFKIIEIFKPDKDNTIKFISIASVQDFIKKVISYIENLMEKRKLYLEMEAIIANVQSYFEKPQILKNQDPASLCAWLEILKAKLGDCEIIDRIELICSSFGDRYQINHFRTSVLPLLLRQENKWGERVQKEIARIWYDDVRSTHLQIRGFDRAHFESSLEEFKKVELHHHEAAQAAVNDQLARRWTAKAANTAALMLLKKESTKQRRVLYPREIMEKGALDTMLRLKPCWLMSPLSISQILPLIKGMFDVIVFDEASQIRVEDAIPAIFRATSMVVVGDPKQMPPTNFFLGGISDEEEDSEDETLAESILDLASRVYPAQMLEWHYRSRSDSLIAFSNKAFYGGRLIAPPSVKAFGQDGALKFINVENAYFTQKNGNIKEAERVIEILAEVLIENSDQSIGIIAMGQSQRVALEVALESRMQTDKIFANSIKIAEARREGEAQVGFFIKNLENVQGDERDIIFISVGYAPPKPGKKLFLNFGPLSKSGGSRRLNVAVTRARSKLYVFASLNPDDIPTNEAAFAENPDSACFGRYLKYVRAMSFGFIDQANEILNSFGVSGVLTRRKSSSFAQDVARRLRHCGYVVSLEVGSSGFFIDVAVHHPLIPGNFILGIECDGAIFHSTPYARDRDKAREKLLTDRGWKIIRIWGPDWSRSWENELERLKSAINKILGRTAC